MGELVDTYLPVHGVVPGGPGVGWSRVVPRPTGISGVWVVQYRPSTGVRIYQFMGWSRVAQGWGGPGWSLDPRGYRECGWSSTGPVPGGYREGGPEPV
jgi:hypothetical protein